MPFGGRSREEFRLLFLAAYRSGEFGTFGGLCASFDISRKCGYAWLHRFEAEGVAGLSERSRRPHSSPQAVALARVAEIVHQAERHGWGAKKVRAWLLRRSAEGRVPAASTIDAILKRQGVSTPRRRRARVPPQARPCLAASGPGDVWTADFKGWFRTGDGARCEPFTLCDGWSRYLIACEAVPGTGYAAVQPLLAQVFEAWGVPLALRTDNGPPFAQVGVTGLSRLAIWLIDLGVTPDRIQPGQPQQNGRHERLHRTLNEATATPPAADLAAQQARFDTFRQHYNEVRPHEALADGAGGQAVPADLFRPTGRRFDPHPPPAPCQPDGQGRRVRSSGEIKWRGRLVPLTQLLAGRLVAVLSGDEADTVCYGHVAIAQIDRRTLRPRPCRPPRAGAT